MIDRLAGCRAAIMAGSTGTGGYTAVVEHGRYPAIGIMAVIAGIAAGDVVGRLAGRRRAVMTAETGANHTGMIYADNGAPDCRAVAVFTYIG